jgi:ribosomal protein L29
MGWLAQSRQVLEINDIGKLYNLLAEQRAELFKLNTVMGSKRAGNVVKDSKNTSSQYRKTKKNIARILTRINQLNQKVSQHG